MGVHLPVEPVESLFQAVKPQVVPIKPSFYPIEPSVVTIEPSFEAVYPTPEALFNPMKVAPELGLQLRDLRRHGEGDEFPQLSEMFLHGRRLSSHLGFEFRDSEPDDLFEVIRHSRLRRTTVNLPSSSAM